MDAMAQDDVAPVHTTNASSSDDEDRTKGLFYASFYAEIAIITVVGIIGNGQLVALFHRRHRKNFRAVNLFMLLLAVVDLMASLWTMPYASLYVSRNLDSAVACKVGFYVSGTLEMMSMATSAMIAWERLRAIRSPHRLPMTRKAAYAGIVGVSTASLIIMSGLIKCVAIDARGECELTNPRPHAMVVYLLALFAVIALIYACDLVIYIFIFAALRQRGKLAARRRNTFSSIGIGIPTEQNIHPKSAQSTPASEKESRHESGTERSQSSSSSSDGCGQHDRAAKEGRSHGYVELVTHASTPAEEERKKQPLAVSGQERGRAAARMSIVINFTKRPSLEGTTDASAAQEKRLPSSPILPVTPPADGGRLSWSSEAGRIMAVQDMRSSAFLIIVLLSLVSWVPFFLSISFPSILSTDAPHIRFLFFINHVINVFVYIAFSPHLRAELKQNLLRPACPCRGS